MNHASKQVKRIYETVLRKVPEHRGAYLDRVCGGNRRMRAHVERLLAAREQVGDFLAEPTRAKGPAVPPGVEEVCEDEPDRGESPGTVIGRFKLLQKIGEGGFGVVYMAEQARPVRRKVALKIIKLGMDTEQVVARFEAERQALALMDHPNIAKVLDGGATESGRPYFVMDLVRGVPITEYCDTARVDTCERLGLFRQVCHAVQHAHTKGIIHRDLKPSNVLVTLHDGVPVPKVIDFGIAKAIDRNLTEKTLFTQFHQMIGTPEYMAPEQAEMSGLDIDTRADVYSLGILLYELLTGTKPFDLHRLLKRGYDEILRTIREEDPPRPSTRVSTLGRRELGRVTKGHQATPKQLGAMLRGDLDWIVMKALDKDRRRRYETASALGDDIQRHLEDQPVLAGPPTALYRLRKYVRRYRAGVIAAACVAVALVAGLAAATWGWLEASDQREVAEKALRRETDVRKREEKLRGRAEKGEKDAKRERDAKEEARADLEKALRRSEGTRLSALSQAVLPRDGVLALLLAIEGAKREPGAFANTALLDALERSPRREIVLQTKSRITVADWSPDETRVATGTMEGGAQVWDSRTGKLLHALETDHGQAVWVRWRGEEILVCFMGKRTPSGTHACDLLAWRPTTGEKRHFLRAEESRIAPEPQVLRDLIPVVDRDTGDILLLSVETGAVMRRLDGPESIHPWRWPQLSPDKARFLSSTNTGETCRLHDAATGEVLTSWEVSGQGPAQFSDDSKLVVTREKAAITVRDARDGRVISTLADSSRSWRPIFREGGREVVSTMHHMKVWDSARGEVIRDLDFDAFLFGDATSDGSAFVGARYQGSIEIYGLESGDKLYDVPVRMRIRHVASDLRFIAIDDAETSIIDPEPAGAALTLRGSAKPSAFALHPDGRHFVNITAMESKEPRVWDLRTGRARGYLAAHRAFRNGSRSAEPYDAAFSPDGSLLVTVGGHGWIHVWQGITGKRLRMMQVGRPDWPQHVTSVDFSPDGRHIAVAGSMSRVSVFDVDDGERVCRLGDAPERASAFISLLVGGDRSVEFSPDGRRVLLRYRQEAASVWDFATEEKLFEVPLDEGTWGSGIAYSPRGRWIFSSGNVPGQVVAGTSVVVEGTSGMPVCKLPGVNGAGPLFPSGFDPQGDHVLTCLKGEGVAAFRLPDGERVRTYLAPGDPPSRACYSPDGRWILGVSHQRFEVYVWDARSGRLLHHVTDTWANTFFHNAAFTKDSNSVLMTTRKGIRVLPVDLLAVAVESRPRDLRHSERTAYEIPETPAPPAPRAWRKPNGVRERFSRETQVGEAETTLRKMLGHLRYTEKRFFFRRDAAWLGVDGNVSWALRRVADRLVDRGHYEEAVEVYRFAIREGVRRYGDENLGVGQIRFSLARLLGQLGRGREIGPHLDGMARSGVDPRSVALVCGFYLAAAGKPKEAIEALEQALDRHDQLAPQGLAEAHTDLGEYEEAESLIRGTYTPPTAYTAGLIYLDALAGVRRFLRLYTEWNKPERIAAWRAKEKKLEQLRPRPITED